MSVSERTPLLHEGSDYREQVEDVPRSDLHDQFCHLTGIPPFNVPTPRRGDPTPESLYHRAITHRRHQTAIYMFTATLTNGLLLSQIVLSAALTGLGASDSSRVLITVFGALNTVIAGLVAFLKSRGQPVRARMFRDDLERVVDEIENSAVMWLGISQGVHGYGAIDIDDQVTVRSEVARLTRLYDRAVKSNTMNDPDMYAASNATDFHVAALRGIKPAVAAVPAPAVEAPVSGATPAPPAPAPVDPDESPATKANASSPKIKAEVKPDSKPTEAASDSKPAEATPDAKDSAKKDEPNLTANGEVATGSAGSSS